MTVKKVDGMIGITADGHPIILPDYVCPYFEADADSTCDVKNAGTAVMRTSENPMKLCWKTVFAVMY